ncbi:transcriptional attenuator, LytR family [Clostridium amylolyticum]|uniref:Transcriptional attenuator, LytR family n=1 Tax=Clostridium amylolyticum TaxID=1121298 RepID=A0A1M6M9H4_9CLOT|nr:LCP family protein [Clostridium amylolyticum]SHJ80020.1 transcriptional attenuator, LytR family [Clostridium amylolyticum]
MNDDKNEFKKRGRKSAPPKKKKKGVKIFLLTLFFLVLFVVGYGAFYTLNILGKVNTTAISKSHADLGIADENKHPDKDYITNILLLGIDKRDEKDVGRSDAMMILTLDTKHKKIKLSSIMRDSYVSIDKHGKDKLNHAYAYGGPELAIKTVNQNFGLNITEFVLVDYDGLESIIDALGGVDIDVKKTEFKLVNDYIHDLAVLKKTDPPYLKNSGSQTLNGMQAVAYSRIRYVGDGDYERTERQRRVLSGMFDKIKTAGITKYPTLVNKLLPYVKTSLDTKEILAAGTDVMKSGMSNLEQERFPVDGYNDGKEINKIWYLLFNQEVTKKQMYDYIFEDIKPTPGNVNKPDLGNTSTKSSGSSSSKTSGTTKTSGTSNKKK